MALAGLAGLANAALAGGPQGFMEAQRQQDVLATNALLQRYRRQQLEDAQNAQLGREAGYQSLQLGKGLEGLSALGQPSPAGFGPALPPPQGGATGGGYGGGVSGGANLLKRIDPPPSAAAVPTSSADGTPITTPSGSTFTPSKIGGDQALLPNDPQLGGGYGTKPVNSAGIGTNQTSGFQSGGIPGVQMANASQADPVVAQVGTQAKEAAQKTAGGIPQMAYGRVSLPALARAVEQANPGASTAVKAYALEYLKNLLAPSEREQFDVAMANFRAVVQDYETTKRDADIANRQANEGIGSPYQIGENWWQATRGGGARQLPLPPGANRPGAGAKPGVNVRVTGDDGKVLYEGAAIQEGGAYKKPDGTPIPAGNVTLLGRQSEGAGRQAESQNTRMAVAANEARRQLQNISQMARGSTTSWFQGLQAERGKGLVEGLTRSLANALTPTDQQIMSTLGLGLGRSLASLETAGAATGLVVLTKTMEGLIPAAGDDTVGTTLTKMAEMRQIAEQAIETSLTTKGVKSNPEQRKLLEDVRADIQQAIPFTVRDVLSMIQNPSEETYSTFAKSMGLGAGQGQPIKIDGDGMER